MNQPRFTEYLFRNVYSLIVDCSGTAAPGLCSLLEGISTPSCTRNLYAVLLTFTLLLALPLRTAHAQATSTATHVSPPHAPGELVIRLSSTFEECAHCLLAKGTGFARATNRPTLDEVVAKYGIREISPLFGGLHAVKRSRSNSTRALGHEELIRQMAQSYLVRTGEDTDLGRLAADLLRDPLVENAEPNFIYSAEAPFGRNRAVFDTHPLPDDPFLHSTGSWGQDFEDLWGLLRIQAPEAWRRSLGAGIVVAIVDTGLDLEHRDIAENTWLNHNEIPGNHVDDDGNGFADDVTGWDFTTCRKLSPLGRCAEPKEPSAEVHDPVGHGTHIAGIIAAIGNNAEGIIGVAPQAKVMAIKALDESGQGKNTDLADAIMYAAENGADVINASWSGPPSDGIRLAIEAADTLFDTVVVAASGNDAMPLERGVFPASLVNVVAVAATTHLDESSVTSNSGGPLDLAAPGGGDAGPESVERPERSILSLAGAGSQLACEPDPGGEGSLDSPPIKACVPSQFVVADGYARASGTSFAAAYVSGVAALVQSLHPEFTAGQIKGALRASADDLGPPRWDRRFGYGRVNAARATEIQQIPVASIHHPENLQKILLSEFPLEISGVADVPNSGTTRWEISLRNTTDSKVVKVASGTGAVHGQLASLSSSAGDLLRAGDRFELLLTVEGDDGSVAQDAKTFLIPDPQFAVIPIPDPTGEGGYRLGVDQKGNRIAFIRTDLDRNSKTMIFDTSALSLESIPASSFQAISPDGRFLIYQGGAGLMQWLLYDIDSRTQIEIPLPRAALFWKALSLNARRLAFTSNGNIDPTVGNRDKSTELFFFDLPSGPVKQVTNGPARFGFEVDFLDVTPNGSVLTFTSSTSFDSSASTAGLPQVFHYNEEANSFRQISGRPSIRSFGHSSTLSESGHILAYVADGLIVEDFVSGTSRELFRGDDSLEQPKLSDDGRWLAFVSSLDLDSRVGNEDLLPEVFLLDLETGHLAQVTDRRDWSLPPEITMSGDGKTFAINTIGQMNGIDIQPSAVWVRRSRAANRVPRISIPEFIVTQEGSTLDVPIHAEDEDGDPLLFYFERTLGTRRLDRLARAQLIDSFQGDAVLRFTPRANESGQYVLRIAAFDTVGGYAVAETTLVIEDTLPNRDTNCDGEINRLDIRAVAAALFDPDSNRCALADANGDGVIGSDDLVLVVRSVGAELSI